MSECMPRQAQVNAAALGPEVYWVRGCVCAEGTVDVTWGESLEQKLVFLKAGEKKPCS